MTDVSTPKIEGPANQSRRRALRRILFILGVPLLIVIAGTITAYVYLGPDRLRSLLDDQLLANSSDSGLQTEESFDGRFFYTPPNSYIVSLVADQGEAGIVNLAISIELESEQAVDDAGSLSALIDNEVLQFLRGLRPADFSSGLALFRVREELTIRISKALSPYRVKAVLISALDFSG